MVVNSERMTWCLIAVIHGMSTYILGRLVSYKIKSVNAEKYFPIILVLMAPLTAIAPLYAFDLLMGNTERHMDIYIYMVSGVLVIVGGLIVGPLVLLIMIMEGRRERDCEYSEDNSSSRASEDYEIVEMGNNGKGRECALHRCMCSGWVLFICLLTINLLVLGVAQQHISSYNPIYPNPHDTQTFARIQQLQLGRDSHLQRLLLFNLALLLVLARLFGILYLRKSFVTSIFNSITGGMAREKSRLGRCREIWNKKMIIHKMRMDLEYAGMAINQAKLLEQELEQQQLILNNELEGNINMGGAHENKRWTTLGLIGGSLLLGVFVIYSGYVSLMVMLKDPLGYKGGFTFIQKLHANLFPLDYLLNNYLSVNNIGMKMGDLSICMGLTMMFWGFIRNILGGKGKGVYSVIFLIWGCTMIFVEGSSSYIRSMPLYMKDHTLLSLLMAKLRFNFPFIAFLLLLSDILNAFVVFYWIAYQIRKLLKIKNSTINMKSDIGQMIY